MGETAGGKKGFVIGQRPGEYPLQPQQKTFKAAVEFCGIKKGIKRQELLDKMKNCIPQYWRDHKGVPEEKKEEQPT